MMLNRATIVTKEKIFNEAGAAKEKITATNIVDIAIIKDKVPSMETRSFHKFK
jgi:hypothetical protein